MATQRLDLPEARTRFASARVARLATTNRDADPHLVPVVFAVLVDTVWTAVDGKPKTTRALRRVDNVNAHPRVCLLVDHYDDDWSALWWVRADGDALVVEASDPATRPALTALAAKYPQYRADPPVGPFIRVSVTRWTSWSAS